MLQMSQHYEPEFKKKIVRLHLEEGRSVVYSQPTPISKV